VRNSIGSLMASTKYRKMVGERAVTVGSGSGVGKSFPFVQLDDGPAPASAGTKFGADLRGPTSGTGYRSEVAAAVANAAALRSGAAVSTSSSSSSSVPQYTSILSGADFEPVLAAKATASNSKLVDPAGIMSGAAGGSNPASQAEYDATLFKPTPEAAVNARWEQVAKTGADGAGGTSSGLDLRNFFQHAGARTMEHMVLLLADETISGDYNWSQLEG